MKLLTYIHDALPLTYPATLLLAIIIFTLATYLELRPTTPNTTDTIAFHVLTACFVISLPTIMLVTAGYTARVLFALDPPEITHDRLLGNAQLGIMAAIAIAAGLIAWAEPASSSHRLAAHLFIAAYAVAIPTSAYGCYHYLPRFFSDRQHQ